MNAVQIWPKKFCIYQVQLSRNIRLLASKRRLLGQTLENASDKTPKNNTTNPQKQSIELTKPKGKIKDEVEKATKSAPPEPKHRKVEFGFSAVRPFDNSRRDPNHMASKEEEEEIQALLHRMKNKPVDGLDYTKHLSIADKCRVASYVYRFRKIMGLSDANIGREIILLARRFREYTSPSAPPAVKGRILRLRSLRLREKPSNEIAAVNPAQVEEIRTLYEAYMDHPDVTKSKFITFCRHKYRISNLDVIRILRTRHRRPRSEAEVEDLWSHYAKKKLRQRVKFMKGGPKTKRQTMAELYAYEQKKLEKQRDSPVSNRLFDSKAEQEFGIKEIDETAL